MDDGSSESRKVREDERIDIYDNGEMDKECTSASVPEENNVFVGKDLGNNALFLGEYEGQKYRKECGHRGVSIENIGLTHSPDKYKVRTGQNNYYLEKQVHMGRKVHITFFFYRKEKCKNDSGKHVKQTVKREAMCQIHKQIFVMDGPEYKENHQSLQNDRDKEHDPEFVRIFDPVEDTVNKRK